MADFKLSKVHQNPFSAIYFPQRVALAMSHKLKLVFIFFKLSVFLKFILMIHLQVMEIMNSESFIV